MTRKEAIEILIKLKEWCYNDNGQPSYSLSSAARDKIYFALEIILDKSIIDEIRDEIEAIEDGITSYCNDRPWVFKDEVLSIIDKYKESENKK